MDVAFRHSPAPASLPRSYGLPLAVCFVGLGLAALAGCRPSQPEVVVYAALDAEFSAPLLERFTQRSGIRVRTKFDTESTKTVGLAQAIIAESRRPRCDVFWNNEILNTLRLAHRGLLEAYPSPVARTYPQAYRDPQGRWHGFAARARILAVNTNLVPAEQMPRSVFDLADPKWRGRVGMAKPLFGTTATHAACLFAVLGERRAREFFRQLKANDVQVLSGNRQVAAAVAAGELAFGLTDTDDAIVEIERGAPITIVYPDRADHELGTLFIPNTLAIVKNGPHPAAARRLIDFLLSPEVETALAQGPSAQIPLNPLVLSRPRVESPDTVKAMQVDFDAAARLWDRVARFIRDEFRTP
jgi:iron(III) transport system substrate-binding protein